MSQEITQPPATKKRRPRLTTQKQREAARINGRKSRGPITVEGKERNRLNSFKHGAYSQATLILPEDQKRFDAIFNDYIDRFQPTSEMELEMIEQMVSSSWRRRRHAAMLHEYWNAAIRDIALLPGSDALSPTAVATKAFEKLLADRAPIHTLEMAELREARKFHSAARTYREDSKWREKSQNRIQPDSALNLIP
jgi:hypothetical protein